MFELLLIPIALIYLVVVITLFIFGINFYYLTYQAIRKNKDAPPLPPKINKWPKVTIQLPIYNELHVAERIINATANMDYPNNLLEIQVLDDSTDETVEIIAPLVEKLQKGGMNIFHIRRDNRQGFKGGALREAFKTASGEFLAIFDADFVPPPNFLKKTIPHFHDEGVAFVQARWGHLNREYSFLTFIQSLTIDAHFMIEQFARSRSGFWFNFNGTAGVWRKEAIADAGGWSGDTLTEDLDLSYRAFLKGWSAVYLRDLEVPAELPVTLNALRRQRHRWAHGSLECAIKLLPQIWEKDLPLKVKVEASLHLTGYLVHLLLSSLMILYPIVILLSLQYPGLVSLFGLALILNTTALAPTFFFLMAQKHLGRSWWRTLPLLIFITSFGAGMMLNTVRAAIEIVRGKSKDFERTPKFGVVGKDKKLVTRKYLLSLDSIVYWELTFALLNIGTIVLGLVNGNWLIPFYAALFTFGLLFTSTYSIVQSISLQRQQKSQSLDL